MIYEDFEKKVLFWQLRGMYMLVDPTAEIKEFFLIHDNVTLKIAYNEWHGKTHFIMASKTTFNQVTVDFKALSMDELTEELEKL